MTLASTLRAVPLFSQLRESDLELLARILEPQVYARNQVVLFAHDPCDAFYVILSGQVKVMLIAEDGKEVILSLLQQGDFFGERALMDDEPYEASAIAMEDSNLLVLRRNEFRRCITDIPEMAFGLLRALCSKLREADQKIGGLVLLDVAGRVSNLFLEMTARLGGDHIPSAPTHQVLAQMVGSSRETVSRTISSMTAHNLIDASGEGITILNRGALERAAGQLLRRRLTVRKERRESGPAPP